MTDMTHQEIIDWLKRQAQGLKRLGSEDSPIWVEALEHHAWLLEVELKNPGMLIPNRRKLS